MVKLPQQGLKVLKVIHILLIGGWFGGGIAMNLLVYQTGFMDQQASLLAAFHLIDYVDMKLVAICAMLTFLTGIVYGVFTEWGFFKYPWIFIKWIITIIVIYTGAIFSSNYLEKMEAMVRQFGMEALQNPEYLAIAQVNLRLGLAQLFLLAIAVVLSVWKKPGRRV